jgi:hypothetical protein
MIVADPGVVADPVRDTFQLHALLSPSLVGFSVRSLSLLQLACVLSCSADR